VNATGPGEPGPVNYGYAHAGGAVSILNGLPAGTTRVAYATAGSAAKRQSAEVRDRVTGVAQLPNRVVEDAEQRHPCAEPEGVRRHPPEPEMPASLHRDLHRVDHNALAADNWSSADFVENGVGRQGSQPTLAKRSQME